ncbi:MAG: response regulator [Deltaproteobacteria bacterium]|nr:response regulator [Deltaproteobacteria bacterium]MCX7952353.1 response regulator [Deltaproteobacteria bacterium]
MSFGFRVFIVDPDSDARLRLRQSTSSVPDIKHVVQFSSPNEALNQLSLSQHVDVVFVSNRLGKQVVKNLIQQGKQTKGGQDSAYVVVLPSAAEGKAVLAEVMMDGADGILCEPFSVEQLREITHLATRVKKERSEARERAAISLLVPEIAKQVDLVAAIRSSGMEPESSLKVLKEMAQKVKDRGEFGLEVFLELFENYIVNLPAPIINQSVKSYSGVSKRLKAKIERKVMEKYSVN